MKKILLFILLLSLTLPLTSSKNIEITKGECYTEPIKVLPENEWVQPEGVTQHPFVVEYSYWAVRFQNIYGDPASVKLAQMILESGWGKSFLAYNAFNYFGITCRDCVDYIPRYDVDEDGNKVLQKFRIFKSAWAGMKWHSEKVNNNSWYLDCKEYSKCSDPGTILYCEQWVKGLQDDDLRWAQDRKYAGKIISIIIQYKLYLLDDINLYYE